MSRQAIEIVRSSFEAFARRDDQGTVRDYAEDVVWDMSGYTDWPGGTTYRGLPAIQGFFRDWLAPWAEWRWEPIELVDAGDQVIVVGRDHGRLRGGTGTVERQVAQVWTVRDGRVVRISNYRTREEALQNLDVG